MNPEPSANFKPNVFYRVSYQEIEQSYGKKTLHIPSEYILFQTGCVPNKDTISRDEIKKIHNKKGSISRIMFTYPDMKPIEIDNTYVPFTLPKTQESNIIRLFPRNGDQSSPRNKSRIGSIHGITFERFLSTSNYHHFAHQKVEIPPNIIGFKYKKDLDIKDRARDYGRFDHYYIVDKKQIISAFRCDSDGTKGPLDGCRDYIYLPDHDVTYQVRFSSRYAEQVNDIREKVVELLNTTFRASFENHRMR